MYNKVLWGFILLIIGVGIGAYNTSYRIVDASINIDNKWNVDAKESVWIMNTMVNWANYYVTSKHGSIRLFTQDNRKAKVEDEVIVALRSYANGKSGKAFNGAYGILIQGDLYFFTVKFIDNDPVKRRYGVSINHAGIIVDEIIRD